MKVYLISFPPNLCPECGYNGFNWDTLGRMDFYARASHSCPKCRTSFQFAPVDDLVALSGEVGGDMRFHIERDL